MNILHLKNNSTLFVSSGNRSVPLPTKHNKRDSSFTEFLSEHKPWDKWTAPLLFQVTHEDPLYIYIPAWSAIINVPESFFAS